MLCAILGCLVRQVLGPTYSDDVSKGGQDLVETGVAIHITGYY